MTFGLLTGLISILMGGIGYACVQVVTSAMTGALASSQALQNHTTADSRMDGLRVDVLRTLHAVQSADQKEREAVNDGVQSQIVDLRSAIKDNTTLPLDLKVKAAFAKVVPLVEPFIVSSQQEIALALRDPAAASAEYVDFSRGFGALEDSMDATRTLLQESVERDRATAAARASWANVSLLAILIGGLLLIVVIATFITRAITRMLTEITTSMADLAAGDLSVHVPAAHRTDEIGAMGKAVLIFKNNAVRSRQLEKEQAAASERRSAEDSQLMIAAQEHAESLVVGSIGMGLGRLAVGDLTFRLEAALPAAYEKLRVDFNKAIAQMQQTMSKAALNTAVIRSGTSEISSASNDLSRRTEQQAASPDYAGQ